MGDVLWWILQGQLMRTVQLQVDNASVDPAFVRFIFQREPSPGGYNYEMRISLDSIDSEVLSFANFKADYSTEKTVRTWIYWLGHIVSRLHTPELNKNAMWVVNTITHLTMNEKEVVFRGECSPWCPGPGLFDNQREGEHPPPR